MENIKGSKKEGAKLQLTKSWGYQVVDYVNLQDGSPVGFNFGNSLSDAEKKYNEIIASKPIKAPNLNRKG